MSKPFRVALKVLLWTVAAIAALLLLVDAAANIALREKNATRLAARYAGNYVNGDISVGGGSFRYITTFPDAVIKLKDVSVCNQADTLVHFSDLYLEAGYMSALKKLIDVPVLRLEGLEVNTFDFLSLPRSQKEHAPFPQLNAHVEIPDAMVSYPGVAEDVLVGLEADALNDTVFNAMARRITVNADALALEASGCARDLLGPDPLLSLEARASTSLDSLLAYLPSSLKGLTARGDVDLSVSGEALLSKLNLTDINETDITAAIKSDGFRLSFQNDTLFASAVKPVIEVRTRKGHPVEAGIEAGRIEIKDSDALVLQIDNSSNRLSSSSLAFGGDVTPHVNLDMNGSQLMLRSGEDRAAFQDFAISATGGVKTARTRRRPQGRPEFRFRRPDGDSTRRFAQPEWLSDSEFTSKDISFHLDRSVLELLRKWTPFGEVSFAQGVVVSPRLPLRNSISSFSATMSQDSLRFNSFTVNSGSSDLSLSGSVRGLYRLLSDESRGAVQLDLKTDSRRVDLDEFLSALKQEPAVPDGTERQEKEKGPVVLPANLAGRLNLTAGVLHFKDFDFGQVKLKGLMRERCIQLTDVSMAIRDLGEARADAFYSSATKKNLKAAANVSLKGVPAQRLLEMFPSLSNSVPLLDTFKGNLACEVAATGQFNPDMSLQMPSLTGSFHIEGKDLVVEDLGAYRKYARMLLFKDRQRGVIDDLNISGTLSDSAVEVLPFLLAVDRYALSFSGRQSFTDGYTYRVSLIESPLPLRVGIKLFGQDFGSRMRFRLVKPQFKNRDIPVYYEQERQMRDKLAADIRNVFARRVDNVFRDHLSLQLDMERMRRSDPLLNGQDEELTEEEQTEMDLMEVEWEIEQQNAELNAEIDKMLEDLWKI